MRKEAGLHEDEGWVYERLLVDQRNGTLVSLWLKLNTDGNIEDVRIISELFLLSAQVANTIIAAGS